MAQNLETLHIETSTTKETNEDDHPVLSETLFNQSNTLPSYMCLFIGSVEQCNVIVSIRVRTYLN
jgi:hypothetical protein